MFGDILKIGGALLGGLGGGSDTEAASAPQSGFATLPKAVQDAYLNTYLPDALKQYQTPYTPVPMVRAAPVQSVFDSQAMADLQQFSDAVGGYFSPMGQSLQQTYNPQPQAPAEDPAAKARQSQIELARQFAMGISAGGARGNALDQGGANGIRQRLLGLTDDQLAQVGGLIGEAGGIGQALGNGQPIGLLDRIGRQLGFGVM